MDYVNVPHDDATGTATAAGYTALMTLDVAVATILHASPVTGMGMDVAAISAAIRAVAPDCMIIVDGIQHAAHGQMDIDSYGCRWLCDSTLQGILSLWLRHYLDI